MTKPNSPAKVRLSTGRPKAARVKDHWISFRVTAEEHFQLIDKAQRSGMVPGDFARSRALRGTAFSHPFVRRAVRVLGDIGHGSPRV